jgi:hypothetical protein
MASCSEQCNYTEKHSRLDGFRCSIERLKVERAAPVSTTSRS